MKKFIKNILSICLLQVLAFGLYAQDAAIGESTPGIWEQINTLDKFLILIALALLVPIYYVSKIFNWSLKHYIRQRLNKNHIQSLAWISLLLLPTVVSAQAGGTESGFSDFNFLRWFLICIILIEALVLAFFGYMLYNQFALFEGVETETDAKQSWLASWWNKVNNFGTKEDEARVDLGHNYDGIRELDNKIPIWFSASFVFTIAFSVIYLWRFHIAEISPLSAEEYQIEVDEAEREHQLYLKTVGSGVDENALAFSTEKGDIEEGKKLFIANCASCHLADGGGQAGPNLTDDNWIYGCSAKDVYQSIKYGRKNGMMAWKDNFNDNQIIQLMDYVHSLHGTKPVTPKAPQGDACELTQAVAESTTAAATDSTQSN